LKAVHHIVVSSAETKRGQHGVKTWGQPAPPYRGDVDVVVVVLQQCGAAQGVAAQVEISAKFQQNFSKISAKLKVV